MFNEHIIPFRDRSEAGRLLASKLAGYTDRPGVLVLALPRGGVPVAFEVAVSIRAPLDVFVVRKLGVPGHEELAMGAVATGGVRILEPEIAEIAAIPDSVIEAAARKEFEEVARQERLYRGNRAPEEVRGKTAILVDDGLATGASMLAAVTGLRRLNPSRIVIAVPVAPAQSCAEMHDKVDEIVCAETPEHFYAVSEWYEDFPQVTDDEVRSLLDRAREAYSAHIPRNTP